MGQKAQQGMSLVLGDLWESGAGPRADRAAAPGAVGQLLPLPPLAPPKLM